MENKNTRISFNDVNKYIGGIDETTSNEKWHKLPVLIKKTIPLVDAVSFVEKVIENSFINDNEYAPEYKDFTIRASMVLLYTNLDLPEDTIAQYAFVYNTDIVEWIYNHIDHYQFDAIIDSIEKKIQYRLDIHAREIQKQVDSFIEYVDSIKEAFTEAFSGVTPDDVKTVLSSISNNGVDEEKLMKAYLLNKDEGASPEQTESEKVESDEP